MKRTRAFSIIELMVVVTTIGIIALMGVPGIRTAKESAEAITMANDLRVFSTAIDIYNSTDGDYPENMTYTRMPTDVNESLPTIWKNGHYSWFYVHTDYYVYLYVYNLQFTPEQAVKIDTTIDDGNIGTGSVRMAFNGSGLVYIFELTSFGTGA